MNMKAILEKIWSKLSLILLWMGISLMIMIFGVIVIGIASVFLVSVPFLILFPKIREKIWEDLITGRKGWKRKKRGKVEAKVVPTSSYLNNQEEDDSKYYYFSR